MWQEFYSVTHIDDALRILAEYQEHARIIAGGTDLILELERKVRPGIEVLIDVSRIQGQDQIVLDEDDRIHLGPLVTHNQCAASKLIVERATPLAQAAWEVGAPQIRNRGTVAGNLITASPANDTITPLMALDAQITLASTTGRRTVPLSAFYKGVRKTVMRADEMLVDIAFQAMNQSQGGAFIKIGLRRAQAISVVNCAVVLSKASAGQLADVRIALGAVAPTIIRVHQVEEFLNGRELTSQVISRAAELAAQACSPIDDLRGSASYRKEMVKVSLTRAFGAIVNGDDRLSLPDQPILLSGSKPIQGQIPGADADLTGKAIETRINGADYTFTTGHGKTLLRLLREEAGLTGTKEGCAEGECGACTVYLDGMAVMSCLVPAERAHGAEIVTIEGLSRDGELHPVQQAFIETGAVQCGYCTPGLIMSAAKLLEEQPNPTQEQIQQAISGNLCRCTGYYAIVEAVEKAASRPA